MFLKRNAQLAYASAGAFDAQRTSRSRQESVMLASSEEDDVNAFGFSSAPRRTPPNNQRPRPTGRPVGNNGGNGSNGGNGAPNGYNGNRRNVPPGQRPRRRRNRNPLFLGIAAIAAVLLLVILIVIIAVSADKSIEMEDNTYVVYSEDGTYSLIANGKKHSSFEGEIEVYPAADRSFAYVTDNTSDGYLVYLLEGKKMTLFTAEAVEEVLAYADYAPGIIFRTNEGGKINICTEKYGEDRITADSTARNFYISGDASTVVYTVEDESNATKKNLYLYRNGDDNEKIISWVTPRGISMDGSYVYVSAPDSKTLNERLFYIRTDRDEYEAVPMGTEGNFAQILATNVSGKEVLYYTLDGTNAVTYLYSMSRKAAKDEVNPSVKIANGIFMPYDGDGKIACYETFKKCYFEGVKSLSLDNMESAGATYYMAKNYTVDKVADAIGKFSADGDYFYFIDKNEESSILYEIELGKDAFNKEKVSDDIEDFAITKKGNLYLLNDENKLSYRKLSSGKNTTVSLDVESMTMLNSGNTLYFTEEESDIVYSTKEGSEKKQVKFDSKEITELPTFVDPYADRIYAFVYDDADGYCLYYSSNARSFKLIASGCDEPELADWIDGLLDIFGS